MAWASPGHTPLPESLTLEIAFFHIRLAPERDLKDDRFHPRLMHLLDLLYAVALLCQEWFQRSHDRIDERRQIAIADIVNRGDFVSLILGGAVMASPDLVLVVQPFLIVVGRRRIENPLAEPFAHGGQVFAIRLTVRLLPEIVDEVRLRGMELRHIRYFLAVAEESHFTRAAEKLHVSQPTLSQQIRELEAELGAPLFDRIGKQVRLTAAGEIFREHAQKAANEIQEARVALGELEGLKRGEVTVGVVQTVNTYHGRDECD